MQLPFDLPDVLILSHPRSGTHFLLGSLASHPLIHARGECFLRHQRLMSHGAFVELTKVAKLRFLLGNMNGRLNVGILMYQEVPYFELLGGSLDKVSIIHLIRHPYDTALSVHAMDEGKKALGNRFRAHQTINESPIAFAYTRDNARVAEMQANIAKLREIYLARLVDHPGVLTLGYEDLTSNKQTYIIGKAQGTVILKFLGLPYFDLPNDLRKSSLHSMSY